jgi:uncharacterized protein
VIHPDTELKFVNDLIGMGVFAKKFIPKGTITWVRDDLDIIIPESRVPMLPKMVQDIIDKYSYRWGDEYILCWDAARYMNHSCEPSCFGTYNFEIAVRDIEPGEELTGDYSIYGINADESLTCACGKPSCRHQILPDDPVRMVDAWDDLYLPAFAFISTVPQPLMPLVKDINAIEQGLAEPLTIITHRQLLLDGDSLRQKYDPISQPEMEN